MKSSAKPSAAQPSATPNTARLAVSRSESTRYGIEIARKRISPPIVGVPAFAWCSCGPSSRICWPNSLTRRYSMNFGPRKIVISIAAIPAISTSPRSIAVEARSLDELGDRARQASARSRARARYRVGEPLEADRARALDQDRVAVAEQRARPAPPRPRGRRPTRRPRSRARARRRRRSRRSRARARGRRPRGDSRARRGRARPCRRARRSAGPSTSIEARCSSAARIEIGLAL